MFTPMSDSRGITDQADTKIIPISRRAKICTASATKPPINHRLRAARIAKFWTQEMASEQAQVSRVAYTRWELGLSQPRLVNLGLLCQAFQMSPEELGFSSLVDSGSCSDPRAC